MNPRPALSIVLSVLVALALSTLSASTTPANAQVPPDSATPCSYVVFRNETSMPLDITAICTAAKPLADEHLQIYVYLTDFLGDNEDAWFAHLDEVDFAWHIQEMSNPGHFAQNAVAFEASTNATRPWGHNVSFGDKLMATPLDADGPVNDMKGAMKNAFASGDGTGAFVQAMTMAFDYAYARPRAQQLQRVTERASADIREATQQANQALLYARTHPTAVPKTPAQIEAESKANNRIIVTIAAILGSVLGVLLLLYHLLGLAKQLIVFFRLWRQVFLVRKRVGDIMLMTIGLIDDEERDQFLALWTDMGGDMDPQNAQVRSDLEQARAAVDRAFHDSNTLNKAGQPFWFDLMGLHKYLNAWETILVTLTGRTPEVMGMTGIEQYDLMNPSNVIDAATNPVLRAQIDAAMADVRPDSLKIKLMVTDPKNLDELGALGLVRRVKVAILSLKEARDLVPTELERLAHQRDEFEAGLTDVHDVLTVADQLTFINVQLVDAGTFGAQGRWTEALEAIKAAGTALASAPEAIADVAEVMQLVTERLATVDNIGRSGFDLDFQTPLRKECATDMGAIRIAFVAGEWLRVREAVDELNSDSKRLLEQAEALVKLREQNEAELARLSTEVARVEARRIEVAFVWTQLQEYPEDNWADLRGHFDAATSTTHDLFDDPSSTDDLASRISRLNSLDEQEFAKAEAELAGAFKRLNEAEQQLAALAARLKLVKEIESTIAQSIVEARQDLVKAAARLAADPTFIDAQVDEQIAFAGVQINEAEVAANKREFVSAQTEVAAARKLANAAYTSADRQASQIKAAYEELARFRRDAEIEVAAATGEFAQLVVVAYGNDTQGSLRVAQELLEDALRLEAKIGGEDHHLATSIEAAVDRYHEAYDRAKQARRRILADKRDYEVLIAETREAIEEASDAITDATGSVSHSDANGAGSTSLDKARSMLPQHPQVGETPESLKRTKDAAEEAQKQAEQASTAAKARIAQEAQKRRDEARHQQELQEAAAAALRRSTMTSISHHSSYSSVSRPSNFGGFGGGGHSSNFGGMSRR